MEEERYGFRPPGLYPQPNAPAPFPQYPSAPNSHPGYPAPPNYSTSPNCPPPFPQHSQNCPPPFPQHSQNYPPLSGITHATLPHPGQTHQAFRWVRIGSPGSIPPTAFPGGVDVDGHQIYVGRAYFEGDWVPAKVIPGKNVAYVSFNGEEHVVDQYEVLCEQRFEWVPASGGRIAANAIPGGQTSDGEPLYIGRAYHEGSFTIGKIHGSHGCCYIPFGGKEVSYPEYECLVLRY